MFTYQGYGFAELQSICGLLDTYWRLITLSGSYCLFRKEKMGSHDLLFVFLSHINKEIKTPGKLKKNEIPYLGKLFRKHVFISRSSITA